jgi:hypothetical protein
LQALSKTFVAPVLSILSGRSDDGGWVGRSGDKALDLHAKNWGRGWHHHSRAPHRRSMGQGG